MSTSKKPFSPTRWSKNEDDKVYIIEHAGKDSDVSTLSNMRLDMEQVLKSVMRVLAKLSDSATPLGLYDHEI